MKTILHRCTGVAAVVFLSASHQLRAQLAEPFLPKPTTLTTALPSEIKPLPVLAAMQRVADWQLAHPSPVRATDWTQGACDAGMMALAGISGDQKYREAMLAMGETNGWLPGPRMYVADDHCVGQTYAELYLLHRNPKMIAPLRERFDAILAQPSGATSLDFTQPDKKELEQWSWCDSLFMGPPAWVRLYAATGDDRYLNFAVTNWWRTTEFLYDKDEHLYFRDSTYFKKTEANGKKVFWSRGNGWVMAGLVRTLQYLPMNHPNRPRFEQLFKDMAGKILACQQPDGLWRSSLLDPDSYPARETSGSGFYTYALAWGVNQGLLDRTKFEPTVRKAWAALVDCVDADGKLTHVQPVGGAPTTFAPDSTAPYGVGAFLLAGSEVYRLAVFEKNSVLSAGSNSVSAKRFTKVSVGNPSSFHRFCETVEMSVEDIFRVLISQSGLTNEVLSWDVPYYLQHAGMLSVMDGVSSRILDSQIYSSDTNSAPYKLLFQVDLAPGETRTYYILDPSTLTNVPASTAKTFARYVPERFDDFAWESDRIAHRMFGRALETWKAEPLTSSGVDVWIKRTRNLIINDMYRTGDYFNTNGAAQDDFKVGKTRGAGGLGIWKDGKLYVSKNWRTYEIITTGPIHSEFELTYDTWDVDGRKISETKRISIDAGSNLSRVESTFSSDDKSPLKIGVGLAERPGENVVVTDGSPEIGAWQNSPAKGLCVQNQSEGWMTYWQPQDFNKGTIAVAIVLPQGSVQTFTNDNPNLPASKLAPPSHTMTEGQPAVRNLLAIAPAEIGKPFVYYLGAGWSESDDFPDAAAWNKYVRQFAERRDAPLQVTIGN
jgi:rhamnogalacturonyl hydrolase YesR